MGNDYIAMKRPRVDELDGLRAILALWVVACHILSLCGFYDIAVPRAVRFFWLTFIQGTAAVDTFMILSGFAISFLLHGRAQGYPAFMTGRFFRIYPVYLVCLVLGIASSTVVPGILETARWQNTVYFDYVRVHAAAERADFGAHVFWHLTLLHGLLPKQLLPDSSTTLLWPAWSISLEWQYYIVAPWLARLVLSGAGLLVLTVVSLAGYYFGGPWINTNWAFLPAQLPLFLIGMGSCHLYEWYCRAGQPRSGSFAVLAVAFCAFVILAGWHRVALLIWAATFGCVFVRGKDLISRGFAVMRWILLLPGLQTLGRSSYSLYLIHCPLILIFLSIGLRVWPELSSWAMALGLFLIGLPLIILGTTVLHKYIELPAMALGKRIVRSTG